MTQQIAQSLLDRRAAAIPRSLYQIAPLFVDHARGAKIWTTDGAEYIDFCGGIGVLNVGHNHPKVVAAVQAQAGQYIHTCWHVVMYEPYVRLAERLNALATTGTANKTALFNSGAEAGENAVKIARKATGRSGVVAFERGFHGRTLMGMSLTGKVHPYSAGFGPFAPEVYRLPYQPFFNPLHPGDDAAVECEARAALQRLGAYHIEPENIACVIVETVLGEGGFYPLHPVAARVLYDWCREHGVLFCADEVQAGFARCGSMLAIERYGLEPDMFCLAKSMGGGMPLSAVTGKAEIMDAPLAGGIGGTYGGNPVSCAAANAVLDVMEEEDLPGRALKIGARIMASFQELDRTHAHVAKPRGLGAMCAIELVDPQTGLPDATRCGKVIEHALEGGLLIMSASGNVLRTLMPLVITDDELDKGLEILQAAIAKAG